MFDKVSIVILKWQYRSALIRMYPMICDYNILHSLLPKMLYQCTYISNTIPLKLINFQLEYTLVLILYFYHAILT